MLMRWNTNRFSMKPMEVLDYFTLSLIKLGKMNTKGLEPLIDRIRGELSVLPFGGKLVDLLKECTLS